MLVLLQRAWRQHLGPGIPGSKAESRLEDVGQLWDGVKVKAREQSLEAGCNDGEEERRGSKTEAGRRDPVNAELRMAALLCGGQARWSGRQGVVRAGATGRRQYEQGWAYRKQDRNTFYLSLS